MGNARTSLAAGAPLLALGVSPILAVADWFYFRRALEFDRYALSAWESAVVFWCIWVKSLVFYLPAVALAELLLLARLRRCAWLVAVLAIGAASAYLLIALLILMVTGNPITIYLPYILDPDAWKWGGGSVALVGGSALIIVVATAAMTPLLYLCNHLGARLLRRFGRRGFASLVTWTFVAVVTGIVPSQYLFRQPVLLENLWDSFPADYGFLAHVAVFPLREDLDERLNPIFARFRAEWKPRPIDEEARIERERPPSVVVFMIESLRQDIVDEETMRNLHRRSADGLVFAHHYAAGNRSELGFFAMFYGRSPLRYFETIDRCDLPQANRIFRNSGYGSALIASADLRWQGIDRYMNERSFDRVVIHGEGEEINQGSWARNDRESFALAAEIVNAAKERPVFVVLYLMSTHFNYDYPPELERFKPSAERTIWHSPWERERSFNRYRNAAAFLDDELEKFLQAIDLERTIVVATSDHAESFYDDGTFSHSSKLSEAQTRTPLVILGAGVPRGRRVERMTTHADVLPTLLHIVAGAPVAVRGIDGRDQLLPRPEPDDLMLVGREDWDEKRILLIRGGERLSLRLHKYDDALSTYGFIDARARLIPHELDEAGLDAWAAIFARHLHR